MQWNSKQVLVFDGGIGTELYDRGFYINRPFEELNISAPNDVEQVHRDYLAAGAQWITTNTFSATRPQLKKFDIENNQEALIEAALKIARKAKNGGDAEIAVSIGPLGVLLEPLGSFGKDEARAEYARFAKIAKQVAEREGFGFHYLLETFTNLDELRCAIDGVTSVDTKHPIIASVSIKGTQKDQLDRFAQEFGSDSKVEALGLNCGEGPSDLLRALEGLVTRINKPVLVRPNAGIPRQLNGRYHYMTSPDYLAKYAKRFAEAGAQGVGGCCGTGPEHIRAVARALKMINARERGQTVHVVSDATSQAKRSWPERKESALGQRIAQGKKVISIEVNPPKGTNLEKFCDGLSLIANSGVEFVNIPDGARASTRVNSLHLSVYVQRRFAGKLTAIPHFTTRDRNLIALQSDLLGAYVNGVHDVLLVTGDPPKLGNNRDATAVYDIDSIGLTYLLDSLNRGVSPTGDSLGSGTSYGIGVASNPTAKNIESEVQRWIYKVESGCDFAVTQPIFDSESFLKWKDRIGQTYRPHLVGIWPLVSLRNAEFMANEVPGVFVPPWILEEMAKSGDNPKEAEKRGIEIAVKVMRQLQNECEGFCISAPLGKIPIALEVLK